MIEKAESLKDTLQVVVDSGTVRIERIHNMIADYARQHVQEIRGEDVIDRKSVYDLVRGINRELGEAATDLFEMAENARLAAEAKRNKA